MKVLPRQHDPDKRRPAQGTPTSVLALGQMGCPLWLGALITAGAVFVLLVGTGCIEGPPGPAGAKGPQGEQGERGPQGIQGPKGKQGEPGPTGATGLQGPQGEPGLRGLQGPQRARGPTGPTGPAGSAGQRGLTGPQGTSGDVGPDFSDFLSEKRDAVVAIFSAGTPIGSGVRISSDEVLTAEHVITGQSSVNLSIKGEGLVFGTVQGYDRGRDIALLTFQSSSEAGQTLLVSGDWQAYDPAEGYYPKWEVGAELAIIGYRSTISSTTPIICFGRISVLWNIVPGDYRYGQTDACAAPGMSGGAVVNNRGNLIGLVLSTDSVYSVNTRFIRVDEIDEALGDLRNGVAR